MKEDKLNELDVLEIIMIALFFLFIANTWGAIVYIIYALFD